MNDIKNLLLAEMEVYFKEDLKRIQHARKVTEFSELLMRKEEADYDIVIAAAVLHDIGIHEAERKYGSTAGTYQEIEGPLIARPILLRLGFPENKITEICDIIAHHHSPGKITTSNFKVLYDADWLVNLKDDYDIKARNKLVNIINRVFLTETGKSTARAIYLD